MPERCPRCEAVLPLVDGSTSEFCAACGLPQLRVSREFLEQPAMADAQATQARDANTPAASATGALDWPFAFRVLLIAALIGLVPCVLLPGAVASGGAGVFALLLLPLLCLGSGSAYLRRRPTHFFSARLGARMGATLALLMAVALTAGAGAAGFVLRYGYHSRLVEQSLNAAILQSQAQMRASSTGPLPENLFAILQTPDGHAGSFLMIQFTIGLLLLLFGTVSGAVSGALLGARQRRATQP